MTGPRPTDKGGVSAVESLILANTPEGFRLRSVPNVRDGHRGRKVLTYLRSLADVTLAVATRKVDLLHAHMSVRGGVYRELAVASIAGAGNVPHVLHAHGADFDEFYARQGPRRRQRIAAMVQSSSLVIALSESWASYYRSEFGLADRRVAVLYNPVAVPDGLPARTSRDEITLVFLGTMDERKGAMRVVNAFALLPPSAAAAMRLVLAGNGDVAAVRRRVAELGLGARVDVLDWIDRSQRDALFARADVLALPSTNEGLPMGMIEAMAWGLVPVTSAVGGIPEVVQDGINGLIVGPHDVPALSRAFERLAGDPALRARLSAAARESIKPLDTKLYGAALARLYRLALANHTSAA